jgi:pyridoxal phosphate enzyme (YggS family)
VGPGALTPAQAKERLGRIQEEIREAALKASRDPAEIALLAVSKTFAAESVATLLAEGQLDFGENYLKEALDKVERLPQAKWHFIGHLQTNKARFVPGLFSCLQSLDSLELAAKLNQRLLEKNLRLDVYVQVTVSGAASKSGLAPADLAAFLDGLGEFPALRPIGLMTMPPYDPDPEMARPYFRRLYELREKEAPGLKGLSMGMSGDFKVAIAEGSTMVRIGTALFGDRGY